MSLTHTQSQCCTATSLHFLSNVQVSLWQLPLSVATFVATEVLDYYIYMCVYSTYSTCYSIILLYYIALYIIYVVYFIVL